MSDYVKLNMRRVENANEIRSMELRLSRLRDSLSAAMDPLKKFSQLDEELLLSLAFEFQKEMVSYRELLAVEDEIKKILGR